MEKDQLQNKSDGESACKKKMKKTIMKSDGERTLKKHEEKWRKELPKTIDDDVNVLRVVQWQWIQDTWNLKPWGRIKIDILKKNQFGSILNPILKLTFRVKV